MLLYKVKASRYVCIRIDSKNVLRPWSEIGEILNPFLSCNLGGERGFVKLENQFFGGKSANGLCNNYQEEGAEKLELPSKVPPQSKKISPNPLCYVKNNVPPPPSPPLLMIIIAQSLISQTIFFVKSQVFKIASHRKNLIILRQIFFRHRERLDQAKNFWNS